MFFFESRKTKFFFLPFVCHLPFAKKREKKNKKREATKIKNLGRKKPPLKIRDDGDDFEKSGKDSELEEEEEEEEARF